MKNKGPMQLLRDFLRGKTTAAEEKKIDAWYESVEPSYLSGEDQERIGKSLYAQIRKGLGMDTPVVPFYKRPAFRVAAVLLILAGALAFFLSQGKPNSENPDGVAALTNDVAPPNSNKAVLKLADGRVIQLDSTAVGLLAMQGKTEIIKNSDGIISYVGDEGTAVTYNTLTVPKGSKPVRLMLADGSEVWLNVASSITYPTVFTGKERKVEISGEAYFEVAKNPDMPFMVKNAANDAGVSVLGTHFNVNAYPDEASMKVTLLEGAVDVIRNQQHQLLSPGQQAVVGSSRTELATEVDLEEVMAWKNGRFYFDGADIKTVMRQVEKWYNVDVRYESEIPYSFVAKISRDVNASELFRILQMTDLVHFKIEGNKITVMK